jgi:hypothetical protein
MVGGRPDAIAAAWAVAAAIAAEPGQGWRGKIPHRLGPNTERKLL